MKPNKTLVFIHLPKTAGSTLHRILSTMYKSVYHIYGTKAALGVKTFQEFTAEKQNAFDVIKGHLTLELLPSIKQATTLTYLRDPIDRFVSSYFYLKESQRSHVHDQVLKMNSIEEFILFSKNIGSDNVQTRHLAGDVAHILDRNIAPTDLSIHGERVLAKAIENLTKMDYVFLTKQFDESLLILKSDLNWPKLPLYLSQNKTKTRKNLSSFTSDEIQKIADCNAWDIKLFEVAKSINSELMLKYNLECELKDFRRKNKFHQLKSTNKTILWLRKIRGKLKKKLGL